LMKISNYFNSQSKKKECQASDKRGNSQIEDQPVTKVGVLSWRCRLYPLQVHYSVYGCFIHPRFVHPTFFPPGFSTIMERPLCAEATIIMRHLHASATPRILHWNLQRTTTTGNRMSTHRIKKQVPYPLRHPCVWVGFLPGGDNQNGWGVGRRLSKHNKQQRRRCVFALPNQTSMA